MRFIETLIVGFGLSMGKSPELSSEHPIFLNDHVSVVCPAELDSSDRSELDRGGEKRKSSDKGGLHA